MHTNRQQTRMVFIFLCVVETMVFVVVCISFAFAAKTSNIQDHLMSTKTKFHEKLLLNCYRTTSYGRDGTMSTNIENSTLNPLAKEFIPSAVTH